jgi:hypothetical protein
VYQRGSELHPLLVAQRQLLHRPLRLPGEAEPFDPAPGGPLRLGPRAAVQRRQIAELAVRAHLRVEAALLGHVAEAALDLAFGAGAAPEHLARILLEHPECDAHGRGLAGAVGADEADNLTLWDDQREPVQRDRVAIAAVEIS